MIVSSGRGYDRSMADDSKPKKRKGTSQDHDFTVKARGVLEQAIGEHLDGTSLEETAKDQKRVERARKAGKAGGTSRSKKLTKKKRAEIARAAAAARWKE